MCPGRYVADGPPSGWRLPLYLAHFVLRYQRMDGDVSQPLVLHSEASPHSPERSSLKTSEPGRIMTVSPYDPLHASGAASISLSRFYIPNCSWPLTLAIQRKPIFSCYQSESRRRHRRALLSYMYLLTVPPAYWARLSLQRLHH